MPGKSNYLTVNGLGYSHKDAEKNNVFENISFELNKNEIVSILGKNGCGKTTLFNVIAGLLKQDVGEIIYSADLKNNFCAFVFQEYSLLDWKTVFGNVALGLVSKKLDKEIMRTQINENLRLFDLLSLKDRLPMQLSGGQKQRVAVARAFISGSEILLLDEPFSALDYYAKNKLEDDLYKIICDEKKSAILITHSIDDAVFFSDRILLMTSQGIYHEIDVKLPKLRTQNLKTSKKFLEIKKEVFKKMI
ncbi:MAG: ABC transporter ATP-binding protein [Candidatus ainarchaeum sp.]|nr:ABC transporter ATP-binding protein [Candidatus ainarchaeum sp.]